MTAAVPKERMPRADLGRIMAPLSLGAALFALPVTLARMAFNVVAHAGRALRRRRA